MNKSNGEPRLRVLPEKTSHCPWQAENSNQSRSFGFAKRPLTTDGTRIGVAFSGVSFGSISITSGSRLVASVTDRKSTRLNSSHPSISYAVFCLKKKKKTNVLALTLKDSRTKQ